MKRVEINIGDLVLYKGKEKDYGIGLVMNGATNFTSHRFVRVKFKDRDDWFPAFSLRKVTAWK